MTTDKPKPREWWIANEPNGKNISNTIDLFTAVKVRPENPPWTHVTEISALREAEREIERLKTEEANRCEEFAEALGEIGVDVSNCYDFVDLVGRVGSLIHEVEVEVEVEKQSEIITELAAALEFSLEGLAMWRKFQSPGNIAEVEERAKQALVKHRGEK